MGFFDTVLIMDGTPTGLGLNVYIAGLNPNASALPVTFGSGTVSISASGGGLLPTSASNSGVFAFDNSNTAVLLSPNSDRIGISIYNDTDQTYLVNLGPSASISVWDFALAPQEYYENADTYFWTGIVTGIGYSTGSGNVRVKEFVK